MKYLLGKGYTVFPPSIGAMRARKSGIRPFMRNWGDLPGPVDMVDVFRASKDAGGIVDRAIELKDEKGHQGDLDAVGRGATTRAAARAEAAGHHRHHGPLPQDRIRAAVR